MQRERLVAAGGDVLLCLSALALLPGFDVRLESIVSLRRRRKLMAVWSGDVSVESGQGARLTFLFALSFFSFFFFSFSFNVGIDCLAYFLVCVCGLPSKTRARKLSND